MGNYGENDFSQELLQNCRAVVQFAREHGKVPAMCEVGPRGGSQNLDGNFARHWWSSTFLEPIKNDEDCSRIAWAMTWANTNPDTYWIPLEGQPSHFGFQTMANEGTALFGGEFALP